MTDAITLVRRRSPRKCPNQVAIVVDQTIKICRIVVKNLSLQNSCNTTGFWCRRKSALLMILRGMIKKNEDFQKIQATQHLLHNQSYFREVSLSTTSNKLANNSVIDNAGKIKIPI